MRPRAGLPVYCALAALLLLFVLFRFSPFAAAVACGFLLSAVAGSLVSLSFMRNKLAGFALAFALTALLSFAAYCAATVIIKGARITLDELDWLLALFFGCLVYAVVATIAAYPLMASLFHRFLSYWFRHQHVTYRPHERGGRSHRHRHSA